MFSHLLIYIYMYVLLISTFWLMAFHWVSVGLFVYLNEKYLMVVLFLLMLLFFSSIKGIFTREFIEYFHQDDSQSLAFITSGLLQSVPLFLSPIVCIVINKYQCRPVAFVGSVILFMSLILTRFFVSSLFSLNIIVGLMTSCGLACVYIPGQLYSKFLFPVLI